MEDRHPLRELSSISLCRPLSVSRGLAPRSTMLSMTWTTFERVMPYNVALRVASRFTRAIWNVRLDISETAAARAGVMTKR
jgi:hypothetical protein